MHRLGLVEFLRERLPGGREDIPWWLMAQVLVLSRFTDPSSELHIAEHSYEHSALEDLLGIPAEKVNDDRLYRSLDALLPLKDALETQLKERLGKLFDIEYDLLLYDVTSTYFEGEAAANPLAQRGYSRDHRPDCKQVCIGLVVTRWGLPLGYEVFAGNRADVTTLEEIVETMESRYGKADRIWVMDRGFAAEAEVEYLRAGGRRYIMGTPKSMLKQYERALLDQSWEQVHEGLEVKLCPSPDGAETFILCRSAARADKEKGIHERFKKRMREGLEKMAEGARKRRVKLPVLAMRVGRLKEKNARAAGLFEVDFITDAEGYAQLTWSEKQQWADWAALSEGCYLLRSNVNDWSGEDLWQAYIQLTQAEAAFRIHKSDLQLRPVWHQKEGRVRAHILVCLLAYVLWKTLGQLCQRAGMGDEPRKVVEELKRIQIADVVLPTRTGHLLRKRRVIQPDEHQAILLERLGLRLPSRMKIEKM
jgi:transposase